MTKVTGWDSGLSQDYDKGLGRWFANRLGARQQLRQDFKMTQLITVDRATLEQLKHSVKQARIFGNDWRRELGLIENTVDAALANAEPAGWQPIDTAPQNEKVLLACDGGIVIGMWRHYRIHNAPKFTHWMPLPTPPKEEP